MRQLLTLMILVFGFSFCYGQQKTITLEKDGVGPIRLNKELNMPKSIAEIYDRCELEEEEGYYAYHCYLNRKLVMDVEDLIGSRNTDNIVIYDSRFRIDNKIYVGMSVSELKKIEGVYAVKHKNLSKISYRYKDYRAIINTAKAKNGNETVSDISYFIDEYLNNYKAIKK